MAGTCVITSAGGAMDAWVYLDHGHVFANAQTGNIVLLAIELAAGHGDAALRHVPPIAAFIVGLLLSRLLGLALKHQGRNSRTFRLVCECGLLLALASVADGLTDLVVTACIGFIAALQITSLSRIGKWSFNTGMTTGNLRSAASALARALVGGSRNDWAQAGAVGSICAAFALGAVLGGFLTPRWHAATLYVVAGMVGTGTWVVGRMPDPLPA